jgi:chemotaxis protein methyltransferase CheR/two-component system chemotaxis response regulator CheB
MSDRYGIDSDIDIVFCRNVLIYFDKPTQRAVLQQIATHVRPGGYLIVGHSESMAGGGLTQMTQISSTVFRK